jgi:hypothetical protein
MDHAITLLRGAQDLGIVVRAEGDMLSVRTRDAITDPGIVVNQIKRNKAAILAALLELPDRLRKGQAWLVAAHRQLEHKSSRANIEVFGDRLDMWDILDSLIVPHVCPIGPDGCDLTAPVICRSCVEVTHAE